MTARFVMYGTVAILQLASLREWTRVLPTMVALVTSAGVAVLIGWYASRPASSRPLSRAAYVCWALVVVLAATAGWHLAVSGPFSGSDRDDAIVIAVERMLSGRPLYAGPTYLDNPLSPTPGWLLLHAPFARAGVYWMVPAMALALCPLLVGLHRARLPVLLFSSAPLIWHEVVTASDLLTAGVLIAASVRLRGMAAGVALAAACSARAPFLALGAAWWAVPPRPPHALLLAAGATLFAIACWLPWMGEARAANGPFQILVLARALVAAMPTALLVLTGVVCAVLVVGALEMGRRRGDRATAFALVALAPLLLFAVADLAIRQGVLTSWTGASYLVPALVALALAVRLEPRCS